MNVMFQRFNHKETEAKAFDTEFGFKEITFCLLCSICYSWVMI